MSEDLTSENGNGSELSAADYAGAAALESQFRALETSILLARQMFMRQAGITFEGARDTYQVFGYQRIIDVGEYRDRYARGGLAGRIVDVMPDATWRGEPAMELVEDEDPEKVTPFEQAWRDLDKKHQICAKLHRVDKLARLSTYAVLLIGATGELSTPLPKGKKLLYLTPFLGGGAPASSANNRMLAANADATVWEYETDVHNERFGKPKTYQLKRTTFAAPGLQVPVDWTRIVHIAEGLLDDEVFGLPALERVWNLLDDLDKVTGGGSEAFFLRANQGLHVDIDKDMALPDVQNTVAALKEQAEAYKHQLTRWLRTRGTRVNTLGSDVANFGPSADAVITQIAGAKGIPKRILTGSEMGELASSQDRENFRDLINGRQTQYAGPQIVRPLINQLIAYGYLPTPKGGPDAYTVSWPHIQALTEQERSTGAGQWAATNGSMKGAGLKPVFTSSEIRDKWYGMAPMDEEALEETKEEVPEPPAPPPMAVPPEDEILPEEEDELKAAQDYKLSSTQVQLPEPLAEALLAYGRSIPAFDLHEEGLEDDAHVTVKYGLHTDDAAQVRAVLADYAGPIHFRLGKTAIFEAEDYDVLYVAVESPDLVELNEKIAGSLEVTNTQPTYVPHATVAYLKKNLGERYVGRTVLEGRSATVSAIVFCPAQGERETIQLAMRAAEDAELLKVLTAAIEAGNMEVVARIVGG